MFVPFETEDQAESGIVYVWIGKKSTPEEAKLIQDVAEEMFNNPWVSLQVCLNICMGVVVFFVSIKLSCFADFKRR